MKTLTLYHGSAGRVDKPTFRKGKPFNDYGLGFYCTEHIELAKEWSCGSSKDGFVNKYEFNIRGLNFLDLSSDEYNVLNWLAILLENRKPRLSSLLAVSGCEYILKNFLPEYKDYDVIKGYRADDSYYAFVRAFVNNQISVRQLKFAMSLGNLGEQVVLKSKRSFERIKFIDFEQVKASVYYLKRKERDKLAEEAYRKESSALDMNGIYIRDIIARNIKDDDQILR